MKYCYLNDKIISLDKAFVRIDDIGILRGYSVFDFLRTYDGKPFLLKEHLQRLHNSAKLLSLELPVTDKKIETLIYELLKKNNIKDAQVRIILTGGRTIEGMGFDPKHPTCAILIEPLALPRAEFYKNGGKLITNTHLRYAHTAKTTNYINAIALAEERKEKGAIEILYIFEDKVLECSTSNFFMVKDNILITPKNTILIGTTRNFVLKLVANKILIEERDIRVSELQTADEAFITATNKEVLPIVKIDSMTVGDGIVGKNTEKIMELFASAVRSL
ncbi:MAG TPA: aminotransferase class IV [Candidatus Sulfotelmatobacter sp.]|jgi:branched-chain amino acid aminotransferase|nr:aminotransferase class IV [Candidatus Sulfotelmatobacter sp.]